MSDTFGTSWGEAGGLPSRETLAWPLTVHQQTGGGGVYRIQAHFEEKVGLFWG